MHRETLTHSSLITIYPVSILNGLLSGIKQWGNLNVLTADTEVVLPVSFTNSAYKVSVASTWNESAIGTILTQTLYNTGGKTTSKFYIRANYNNAMDWIAIGY